MVFVLCGPIITPSKRKQEKIMIKLRNLAIKARHNGVWLFAAAEAYDNCWAYSVIDSKRLASHCM